MRHSSTRDLYGYWNKRRGGRTAPDRADIDPTAIPRVLADTFLLGEASGQLAFRLAGTRVCALFCRELKGTAIVDLFGHASTPHIQELLGIVCDESVATIAGVTAVLGDGTSSDLELLLLPLRYHGRTDARILGALAPITTPYWIGTTPVTTLSLGTLRYIGPTAESAPASSPPGFTPGRMRRGFLIYDGGRQ